MSDMERVRGVGGDVQNDEACEDEDAGNGVRNA